MPKSTGKKRPIINNAAKSYERGVRLLAQYKANAEAEEPLPQEEALVLVENAISAFASSERQYDLQKDMTPSSKRIARAEVALEKGEALSLKASWYQGQRDYNTAIEHYRASASELLTSQNIYSSALGGIDSEQCYQECYLAMARLVNVYAARSECHDGLEDFIGSSKWRGVTLKHLSGIRTGYASYLATGEGRKHEGMITALEEETRALLQQNEPKVLLQEIREEQEKRKRKEPSEAITWRDRLRGPAAFVSLPARDWVDYAQSSKRTCIEGRR